VPRTHDVHSARREGCAWIGSVTAAREGGWLSGIRRRAALRKSGRAWDATAKSSQSLTTGLSIKCSSWLSWLHHAQPVQVIYCGGRAPLSRRDLLPFMPKRLSAVAPLWQWSHDRAMHLGKDLFDRATCARPWRWKHSDLPALMRLRAVFLTSRCRRTVNDKVHTSRRWRAAAELGRYIPVSVPGTFGVRHARCDDCALRTPAVAAARRGGWLSWI
jgi:hypothetical protein